LKNPVLFRVPYIATSDQGLALLLREIAYFGIDIENGKGFGYPGFRAGGIIASYCPEAADTIVAQHLSNVPVDQIRLQKLDKVAEEILSGIFTYEEYLIDN
jgi:hypothetical protein